MQEALTNSLKHAQCTHILIKIVINNPIEVLIEDNGIGFDTTNTSAGYGLQNMQDRASEAGLEAIIQSEKGKGTRISFRF
jgi:signal transduction histidine kinase